jgi:hypothetical protein
MPPKRTFRSRADDLFRSKLDNIIDPRHELVQRGGLIDWPDFEKSYAAKSTERQKVGLWATGADFSQLDCHRRLGGRSDSSEGRLSHFSMHLRRVLAVQAPSTTRQQRIFEY